MNKYEHSRHTATGAAHSGLCTLHTLSIAPTTATPTAGLLTVYDSTAASGTAIYTEWVFATTPGHTIILDVVCRHGIHVAFDGTLADVTCTVAWSA